MQDIQEKLAKEIAKDCKTVDEIHARLKSLFKNAIEEVLEGEISSHLGYDKHDSIGDNTGNSRNGYSKKTIKSQLGETTIDIPRDRNGEFEPQIIRKYEKNANELEEQILAMYAKGMSTRDIESHLRDIYGIDVSAGLVSRVTDKIMPLVTEWQARSLESIYPVVFLDAIHFKVRKDNKVINKAAYTVLGLDIRGQKDILGIWIGENESASFWLGVCNDLKSRGVEDILIACIDGLTSFSDAIKTVFPQTATQLCIVHQLRNSLKFVNWKDRKVVMADLKPIYQASTLEEAELAFQTFRDKWGNRYPAVIKSWEKNWLELTTYFSYPYVLRRLIYTTNAVEAYHRQLRKVTKTKTAFPTDDSLRKVVYLATMDISKKWTMSVQNWAECLSQLVLEYGDRIANLIAV